VIWVLGFHPSYLKLLIILLTWGSYSIGVKAVTKDSFYAEKPSNTPVLKRCCQMKGAIL